MTTDPSRFSIRTGDSREILPELAAASADAIVTDPPYHLTQESRRGSPRVNDPATPFGRTRLGSRGFMGETWDGGDVAFRTEFWAEALRVLKPGGHVLAFGGTRTWHRLATAIEMAGFELRDSIAWIYGNGMPKSRNFSRDFPDGAPARETWAGWGTTLKPALEPIVVARRPLDFPTVAQNVEVYGTGGVNVEACRIPISDPEDYARNNSGRRGHAENRSRDLGFGMGCGIGSDDGRWPANVILDEAAAAALEVQSPGASRFFYVAKASKEDRGDGNDHPTVKPTELMGYLARLVTPPDGLILDPFAGSGSTGVAALREGFRFLGVELDPRFAEIATDRLEAAAREPRAVQTALF